ncbi:large ribosomal subunit protein uL23-like [Dasypus novemcinctus]|uniref:large ribosomal subunit protein uL23-like n=1 Tax=Dasypus novemcinctus TaxID=9361 RepID=UPI00265EAA37|nr:large ribosomal subunit protein uL23-like [Dasypus novemcinctus]
MKIAPKAKKKASAPPKTETQAEALEAKKAVLKGIHSHQNEEPHTTHPPWPKMLQCQRQSEYPQKSTSRRNKRDHWAIIHFPTTKSTMRKIKDSNTLAFTVDDKANKHQVKQAAKKLYDINAAKVNTQNSPGGEKKTYVCMAPDYHASDVANEIGII